MWTRIKSLFRHSMTILWARIVAASGVALAYLVSVAQDPTIQGAVQQVLQPKFIPYWIIGIGLVTELARRRTAGKA